MRKAETERMDKSIDDLIEEIFSMRDEKSAPYKSRGWDSSSDSTRNTSPVKTGDKGKSVDKFFLKQLEGRDNCLNTSSICSSKSKSTIVPRSGISPKPLTQVRNFDESTEDEEEKGSSSSGMQTQQDFAFLCSSNRQGKDFNAMALAPPFPSLPPVSLASCPNRCYVTNISSGFIRSYGDVSMLPSVERLKKLSKELCKHSITSSKIMLSKGAFYVNKPEAGNGCLDGKLDTDKGGCPHVLCLKCNYIVIRLQGAEWNDDNGNFDLYLTTRNYYPDWCRIATSNAFLVSGDEAQGSVLRDNPHAAAYCCQCSCLTVKSTRVCIETKLTDVTLGEIGNQRFALELPLGPSDKQRRPPLWVCKGHCVVQV